MMTATLNTLKYAKRLEKSGVPREQAEAHAEALYETAETIFATKKDLNDLKEEVQRDFAELRTEVQHDMQILEGRLTNKLTVRLGMMLVGSFSVFSVVMGFMLKMTH